MRRFLDLIEAKYLRHLPYILGAMTFLACSAFLSGALLHIRNNRPTTAPIADTATIVVFEQSRCLERCDTFRSQIGRPHLNSDLADKLPLRYFDITDSPPPRRYALARGIGTVPTAVVFDIYGREQGRFESVPTDLDEFHRWAMPHVRRAERDREFAMSRGIVTNQ